MNLALIEELAAYHRKEAADYTAAARTARGLTIPDERLASYMEANAVRHARWAEQLEQSAAEAKLSVPLNA